MLELADRLWPGAEGWFESGEFCILTLDVSKKLSDLLAEVRALSFDVGDDNEADEPEGEGNELPVDPIHLAWKTKSPAMFLDWWTDKSIKPWAGSMKERIILRAMLDAIDPQYEEPFADLKRVMYQSPKLTKTGKAKKAAKKEPFYFDPRRGNKSHPLDCGFSPDAHKMEAECCPALEALCFIGLQRARPARTSSVNQSKYTVWPRLSSGDSGIPANLIGAVTCGCVQLPGSSTYVFDNYFRTDQRKHKTFSNATLERSINVQSHDHPF